MTLRNHTSPKDPTDQTPTGPAEQSGLSGPGWANLSALTRLGDLSHLAVLSEVDKHDGPRDGGSLGGLLGGSLVRETPSEPPPGNRPTTQVSPADRPIRDRAE